MDESINPVSINEGHIMTFDTMLVEVLERMYAKGWPMYGKDERIEGLLEMMRSCAEHDLAMMDLFGDESE